MVGGNVFPMSLYWSRNPVEVSHSFPWLGIRNIRQNTLMDLLEEFDRVFDLHMGMKICHYHNKFKPSNQAYKELGVYKTKDLI